MPSSTSRRRQAASHDASSGNLSGAIENERRVESSRDERGSRGGARERRARPRDGPWRRLAAGGSIHAYVGITGSGGSATRKERRAGWARRTRAPRARLEWPGTRHHPGRSRPNRGRRRKGKAGPDNANRRARALVGRRAHEIAGTRGGAGRRRKAVPESLPQAPANPMSASTGGAARRKRDLRGLVLGDPSLVIEGWGIFMNPRDANRARETRQSHKPARPVPANHPRRLRRSSGLADASVRVVQETGFARRPFMDLAFCLAILRNRGMSSAPRAGAIVLALLLSLSHSGCARDVRLAGGQGGATASSDVVGPASTGQGVGGMASGSTAAFGSGSGLSSSSSGVGNAGGRLRSGGGLLGRLRPTRRLRSGRRRALGHAERHGRRLRVQRDAGRQDPSFGRAALVHHQFSA